MKRRGFTLPEVLLATILFSFMAVAIFSAFIGGQRMLKLTLARGELALRTRELRDKLLFHAAPAYNGTTWAGILTATNANSQIIQGNGLKVLLYANGLKNAEVFTGGSVPQKIELRQSDASDSSRYLFSEDRYDERWKTRWLHPGNLDLFAGNDTQSPIFDTSDLTSDKRFYVNVRGRIEVGGITVAHDERIVVPLFGAVQPTEADNRGGLCD